MKNWKKVKIGGYLIPRNNRYEDIKQDKQLEVYGVSNILGITKTQHKKSSDLSKYVVVKPQDLAYNPYRINVGSIGLVPPGMTGLVSPAYIVFSTDVEKLLPELLLSFLKSKDGLFEIKKNAKGTVRQALRYENLCNIEMLIPSIEIQREIIRKKVKADNYYVRLKNEFINQKTVLQKLRQAILQDAIEGKLTIDWRKKNPDIEPASELLKKIKAEKEKLVAEKKIKKEKLLPEILKEEIPFNLPKGWEWCRLGEIGQAIIGLVYSPHQISEKGRPVLRANNIFRSNLDYNNLVKVTGEIPTNKIARAGDILICVRSGSKRLIGKAAIIEKEGMSFGAFMSLFRSNFNDYVFYFLLSDVFRIQIDDEKSTGINQLTQGILKNILFPFPPLSEQKAIVAKVENLMQKLDKLEAEISQNQKTADMLMQAVLKEAFEE